MGENTITLKNLSKTYDDLTVLDKLSLDIKKNIYENKSFILKIKKLSKDEIDKKVKENYIKWIFQNTKTAEDGSELGMDISRRHPYNVLIC